MDEIPVNDRTHRITLAGTDQSFECELPGDDFGPDSVAVKDLVHSSSLESFSI